jgi:hypothetical protein
MQPDNAGKHLETACQATGTDLHKSPSAGGWESQLDAPGCDSVERESVLADARGTTGELDARHLVNSEGGFGFTASAAAADFAREAAVGCISLLAATLPRAGPPSGAIDAAARLAYTRQRDSMLMQCCTSVPTAGGAASRVRQHAIALELGSNVNVTERNWCWTLICKASISRCVSTRRARGRAATGGCCLQRRSYRDLHHCLTDARLVRHFQAIEAAMFVFDSRSDQQASRRWAAVFCKGVKLDGRAGLLARQQVLL